MLNGFARKRKKRQSVRQSEWDFFNSTLVVLVNDKYLFLSFLKHHRFFFWFCCFLKHYFIQNDVTETTGAEKRYHLSTS